MMLPYPLIFITLLCVGLFSSLAGLMHLAKQNATLKERILQSLEQVQEQNKQIKQLELDAKSYIEHRPVQTKIIRERYKDVKSTQELKTCEQQLKHLEMLVNLFKKGQ